MMDFGSMWATNSKITKWLIEICCVFLFCACSVADPDIPDYESVGKEILPVVSIKSADHILLREALLHIEITPKDKRMPRKLYLCYGKDADQPDTTGMKVDLLPLYKEGIIEIQLSELMPSSLYYCRVYAEMVYEKKYSDVFKFKTEVPDINRCWEKVCDFPSLNNWYESAVVIEHDVYMRGMSLVENLDQGDGVIWRYTPSTDEWYRIKNYPGKGRSEQVMFSIAGRLYVGLGCIRREDQPFLYEYQTDFWEYDPETDDWIRRKDYPKADCAIMGTFGCKGKGYIVSSDALWSALPMNVFMYDPDKDQWSKKADFPGKKVSKAFFATVNDRNFVIGGAFPGDISSAFSNYVWEYEPDMDTWFRRADFPGSGRWSPCGFVIDNRIYAGYGEEYSGRNTLQLVNDLWVYDVIKDSWYPRSSFSDWFPSFLSLSFGVDGAGYVAAFDVGLWKYTPERDE